MLKIDSADPDRTQNKQILALSLGFNFQIVYSKKLYIFFANLNCNVYLITVYNRSTCLFCILNDNILVYKQRDFRMENVTLKTFKTTLIFYLVFKKDPRVQQNNFIQNILEGEIC